MLSAKSLVRGDLWWSSGDSNPGPPHCESDYRKNAKYLPFRKLQPPRDFKGFPVLSHSLPSRTCHVLLFLSTYWPLGKPLSAASSSGFLRSVAQNAEAARLRAASGNGNVRPSSLLPLVSHNQYKILYFHNLSYWVFCQIRAPPGHF